VIDLYWPPRSSSAAVATVVGSLLVDHADLTSNAPLLVDGKQ